MATLALTLSVFGWLLVALTAATCIAFVLAPSIPYVDASDAFDVLLVASSVVALDAARERAIEARRAFYRRTGNVPPGLVCVLPYFRSATVGELTSLPGIGARKSRRIIEAGEALTPAMLLKILGFSTWDRIAQTPPILENRGNLAPESE